MDFYTTSPLNQTSLVDSWEWQGLSLAVQETTMLPKGMLLRQPTAQEYAFSQSTAN